MNIYMASSMVDCERTRYSSDHRSTHVLIAVTNKLLSINESIRVQEIDELRVRRKNDILRIFFFGILIVFDLSLNVSFLVISMENHDK